MTTMAFTSQSLAKAGEYAERMSSKMAKLREHAEGAIGIGEWREVRPLLEEYFDDRYIVISAPAVPSGQ